MIQIERADAGVFNRWAWPSQWFGSLFHSLLSHAAHPRRILHKDLPELSIILPFRFHIIGPVLRRILSIEPGHRVSQINPDLPVGFGFSHARNSLFLPADSTIVTSHINSLHLQPAAN